MKQLTFPKTKYILFIISAVAAALLAIPTANAETVFRYGSEVSVSADQKINGDFYAFSGNWWTPQAVNVSGQVDGDIYTAGDTITINGLVKEDVAAIGFSIQIHGAVDDDVRVIGGSVVIAEEVGGDLFVVAEKLTILSSANIKGNVYFYGGSAELSGSIGGSIHGYANKWRIDGLVGDDVDVHADSELTLGDRANIVGDVTYKSNIEMVRSAQSAVEGDVIREEISIVSTDNDFTGALTFLFSIVFACFFLYLLKKRDYNEMARSFMRNVPRNFIVGFLAMFIVPFVSLFLIVTVLGSMVGFVLLFVYLLSLVLAFINLPVITGLFARKIYDKKVQVDLLTIGAGAFGLFLMLIIPILGPLFMIALLSISLGEMFFRIYNRLR